MPRKVLAAGSAVVAGGSNSDLVAAGGGKVLVYSLGVQCAAAVSTAVLSDGGVASGVNNRWSVSGAANGQGGQINFDPPLLMPNGLRLTATGASAFGYVQYAKSSESGV